MKCIKLLLILLSVGFLSSCDYFITVEEPVNECTEEDNCTIGDEVTLIKEANVTDLSEHYSFEKTTLNLYEVNVDQGTDYVLISEFLELLDPTLTDYRLEDGSFHTVNLYFDFSLGNEQYSLLFKFNEESNLLVILDYSVFQFMTTNYETDYLFEFDSEISSVIPGRAYKEIDFDDYGFDIVKVNEEFYIPLSIANLFFSGDSITVYSNNRDIYLLEDIFENQELFSKTLDESIDEQKIMEDTTNYFRLLFDYFYGLESIFFTNGSSFISENEALLNADNITDYNKALLDIIYQLDDIHTGVFHNGYNVSDDYFPLLNGDSRFTQLKDNLQEYVCDIEEEGTLSEYSDYYVFKIDVFTENTKSVLSEQLKNLDSTKDIYLDLRCNTGGMIGGMYDMLSYLTNTSFKISYQLNEINTKITESVTPKVDNKLDNNFIVVTSGATFSAGNIFTSIVKDNNLAYVVGHQTLGGACPVGYTTLPNGMIMTYSINTMFTSTHNGYVEYGVMPDKYYSDISDISVIHQDLNKD